MIKAKWIADTDLPKGTPIVLHLHNHGDNEYNLLEVSVGAAQR